MLLLIKFLYGVFHHCFKVSVLKPSHKSTFQSKVIETPADSVSAVQNATNATRDMESEYGMGQDGKITEIVMDNVESEPTVFRCFEIHYLAFMTGDVM